MTNQGNYTGTNVRLIDQLPAAMTYGGSGGTYGGGWITWTLPTVNPFSGTATAWFSGTLACTAGAAVSNQNYRVESSDQGVTSTNGSPVSFAIAAPAITASLTHGPEPAIVNGTILFTATTGTNGTPLSYAWNFGDGLTASGLTASHVYTHDGSYTAIFTATDACNFTRVQTSTVTVNPPTINANFNQSATSVVVNGTVRFTDTSSTDGPPIVAWGWNFGDSSLGTTQHPTHTYTTIGSYTVTLQITDSLGYTATRSVINAVIVQPLCTSLTNVAFTFAPIKPLIHRSVAFTASTAETHCSYRSRRRSWKVPASRIVRPNPSGVTFSAAIFFTAWSPRKTATSGMATPTASLSRNRTTITTKPADMGASRGLATIGFRPDTGIEHGTLAKEPARTPAARARPPACRFLSRLPTSVFVGFCCCKNLSIR